MRKLTKSALTEVPLSPEERYLASQHVGRSLFGLIQLAKEKEMIEKKRNIELAGEIEDSPALKIPIPIDMLPQKTAGLGSMVLPGVASRVLADTPLVPSDTVSVIERPDGTIEQKVNKPAPKPGMSLPKGKIGIGAGLLAAGLPGAAVGGVLGSVLDSKDPYKLLPEHVKTVRHLDGSVERIYAPKEEQALANLDIDTLLNKHKGKLLGAGGAAALLSGSKKSLPLKLLLAAPLALAGGVVGKNLIDDPVDEIRKKEVLNNPKFKENVLKEIELLDRKNKEMSKSSSDQSMFANALANLAEHPARNVLGAQEGFKQARKDYFIKQKMLLAQQLDDAQREYLETLKKIKVGEEAVETPLVDCFCNGVAHHASFGKTASQPDVDIEEGAFKRLLSDVTAPARRNVPFLQPAANVAVNTAAASAYLTYLIKKKMREEPETYMYEKLPTRVELQPF